MNGAISNVTDEYAIPVARLDLAVIYLWFGALKLAGVSPVNDLVEKTAVLLPRRLRVPVMGMWEVTIGLGLLARMALRPTLLLLGLHLISTFMVIVIRPGEVFRRGNPLLLTERGEFIMKNLVLLAAALAVGGRAPRQ
jgi:uncharacterized membrane protein YkgB